MDRIPRGEAVVTFLHVLGTSFAHPNLDAGHCVVADVRRLVGRMLIMRANQPYLLSTLWDECKTVIPVNAEGLSPAVRQAVDRARDIIATSPGGIQYTVGFHRMWMEDVQHEYKDVLDSHPSMTPEERKLIRDMLLTRTQSELLKRAGYGDIDRAAIAAGVKHGLH